MDQRALERRHPVGGELHDEGGHLAPEQGARQHLANQDGKDDSDQIDREDHGARPLGEKGAGQEDVDGEPGAAAHKGVDQDSEEAVALALQGPRGHDGRGIAPEAHDHRDEGLPVESDGVHHLVHEKRCAGHVSRVLEQGDAKEEDEDVREKDDDPAHPSDYTVDQEIPENSLAHSGAERLAEPSHALLDPAHGEGAHVECELEHRPDEEDEEREPEEPVGEDRVHLVGEIAPVRGWVLEHLAKGAADEPVALVRDDALRGLVEEGAYVGAAPFRLGLELRAADLL